MFPAVTPVGTNATISVSDNAAKEVLIPSNVTPVASLNPVPVSVTNVFSGPVAGENDVTSSEQGGAKSVTIPFSVKSSIVTPPVPLLELLNLTIIVTVPVSPVTGLSTLVSPISNPVVGTDPLPTAIPLMVMFQVGATKPDVLRLQKLKEFISSCLPDAILNVSVKSV